MKIIYLACGSGSGPLVKGLAIEKALTRRGVENHFLTVTNSAFSHIADKRSAIYQHRGGCDDMHITLNQAVRSFHPEVIISCYGVSQVEAAIEEQVPCILLWRKMSQLTPEETVFHPDLWNRIYGIEPEALSDLSPSLTEKLIYIPPIHSIWPEELYPRHRARKMLLDSWEEFDNNMPLLLVTHNGLSSGEVDKMIVDSMGVSKNRYKIIAISQNRQSNGRYIQEPVAKYFAAVDHLVAAPSQTIFWEWERFKSPGAQETFLEVDRKYDPQSWRKNLDKDTVRRYNTNNGADSIVDYLLELFPHAKSNH